MVFKGYTDYSHSDNFRSFYKENETFITAQNQRKKKLIKWKKGMKEEYLWFFQSHILRSPLPKPWDLSSPYCTFFLTRTMGFSLLIPWGFPYTYLSLSMPRTLGFLLHTSTSSFYLYLRPRIRLNSWNKGFEQYVIERLLMNYFSLKGIHSTGMWHLPKPSLVSGESLMYQLWCLYGTVPCLQWNKFFF